MGALFYVLRNTGKVLCNFSAMQLVATRWQHTQGVWFCRRRRHPDERGRAITVVSELFNQLHKSSSAGWSIRWDFDTGTKHNSMPWLFNAWRNACESPALSAPTLARVKDQRKVAACTSSSISCRSHLSANSLISGESNQGIPPPIMPCECSLSLISLLSCVCQCQDQV